MSLVNRQDTPRRKKLQVLSEEEDEEEEEEEGEEEDDEPTSNGGGMNLVAEPPATDRPMNLERRMSIQHKSEFSGPVPGLLPGAGPGMGGSFRSRADSHTGPVAAAGEKDYS